MRLILIFLVISLSSVLITYLIYRIFSNKKHIKYTPSVLFMILGIYNIIMAKFFGYSGFEDLAKFLLAQFWFVASISSFIFIILLDKYKNNSTH